MLQTLIGGEAARYCILQRYVPEIAQGETRTLVSGGTIIGSYLRTPQDGLRANLNAGASPTTTELECAELSLVQRLAGELLEAGAAFAAVDTAHGYLVEVNIANPGGLATLSALYGEDPTPAAVAAIASSTMRPVGALDDQLLRLPP